MNLQQFTSSREAAWTELHALVERAGGHPERVGTDGMLRAGRLYRAAAADLAFARRRFPGDPVTTHLTDLVRRARDLVYGKVTSREGFWWFLHRGFWVRIRERRGALLLAIGLTVGSTLLSGVWAHQHPEQALRVIPSFASVSGRHAPNPDKHLSPDSSTGMSAQIFTNNISVAIVVFAGGLTLGLLTAWELIVNGLILGLLGGIEVARGATSPFLQLIVPHGLLELSLFVVAAEGGFRLATAVIRPGPLRRTEALAREARPAVELLLGASLLLVPCGLVEGFVTPAGLGLAANLTIGLVLFAAFWGLVLWRGASHHP